MTHYKQDTTTNTTQKLVEKLQAKYEPQGGWTDRTSTGDYIGGRNYLFIPAEELTPRRIYSWLVYGYGELAIISDSHTAVVLRAGAYPTMCGGTVVSAKSVPTADVVNPTHADFRFFENIRRESEPDDSTLYHPSTMFRRWNSGIMVFYVPPAVIMQRGGARLLNSLSKMISLMQEKDDEFTCDGGVANQRRRFSNYGSDAIVTSGNYIFVTHYEWAGDHDSYASGDMIDDCGYCGSEVDDSGFCPECEEYVYDPDDMCCDDESVGCRADWVAEALRDDSPWERTYTPHYESINVSHNYDSLYQSPFEHNAMATSLGVLSCWQDERSSTQISSCEDDVDYLSTMFHLIGGMNVPFLISSNVGSPSYRRTRYVMAVLSKHAEEFADRECHVVWPSGMGSNPNERYHYIDSCAVLCGGSRFAPGTQIEDPLEAVIRSYFNSLDKEAA